MIAAIAACGHHAERSCAPAAHVSVQRVDDGSPYMQKLTVPTTSETWRAEDGATHTDLYLRAADRTTLQTTIASLAEPVPADHELVVGRDGVGWRSYYVLRAPVLDETAFVGATASASTANIDLSAAAGKTFGEATRANVGHKLAIVVEGDVAMAPVVNTPILGGKLQITTTDGDAAAFVKRLACK